MLNLNVGDRVYARYQSFSNKFRPTTTFNPHGFYGIVTELNEDAKFAKVLGYQVEDNGNLIPDQDYICAEPVLLGLEGRSSIVGELQPLNERELGEILVEVYNGGNVMGVKENLRDIGRCERDRDLIDELEQRILKDIPRLQQANL